MKVKKQTNTKMKRNTGLNTVPGLSATHIGTEEQARNEFHDKVIKSRTESDNRFEVDALEAAIKRAALNGPFSIYEVRRELGHTELTHKRITELFAVWLKIQLDLNRITEVQGCYDHCQYMFV